MRSTPEYNRVKIPVTFAASGDEYVDTTTTTLSAQFAGLLHSLLVVGHTWPVAAAGASGASGANVIIIDEDSNTVKTFAEVLTGATTLLSGDIMIFPTDTIRYQITDADGDNRCVSGSSCIISELPTATVILYMY